MFSDLNLLTIAIVVGVLLVSISIHEMMHAFVGLKLGDDTAAEQGRISLNPLQHIDPIMTVALPAITILLFGAPILAAKPVPFNPERVKWDEYGAALIAAAGPFSNLALALIAAVADNLLQPSGLLASILQVFVFLNVSLFVFNLIPIPPLDGSRVLYAFSPEPLRRVLEMVEPFGFFVIIALVLLGGFGGTIGHLNQLVLNLLP